MAARAASVPSLHFGRPIGEWGALDWIVIVVGAVVAIRFLSNLRKR
jgi:hypothetical protein